MVCLLLLLPSLYATAQQPEDSRLSVNFSNTPLKQALKEIEGKSTLKFVFNDESLAPYKVSLKATNEPLKQVLANVLKGTKLDFQLKDNKCIIVERKGVSAVKMTTTQAQPASVPMTSLAQRRLRGKVLAADNNAPLANASINVRGQENIHSMSDEKGEFVVVLPPSARVLVITHVGYNTKEVVVGPSDEYVVGLEVSQEKLNEVVVMGPFNRKQESFTGSSATFTQEQLRSVGNQNLIQSLKILDPSFVQIENNLAGSDPNTLPNLQIRGGSSLPGLQGEYSSMANLPLFILDGFETTLEKIYDRT
ncbi:carboxypeptidase-like regulatory domain-containing protein [Chitinophaga sedimenti]|uniref:DUF4974 domain-containing protein n=1 Tax=Chitinophaga sedimenti TaxID=2033606 RepID=UPI0020041028|nr:DUF4974 domain-containing protein [Chitinophaga sedimenti]MCK7554921.1 carboxypeptidase-like regulatory domain-containing protein [Chitinophaga sedimenti]